MSWKKYLPVWMLLLLLLPAVIHAQTLFSYGGNNVSRQEFLDAYYKNNLAKKPDRQDLENYLELYIRYRLKIQWAYQSQLDTLPSVQQEWDRFRNQVAGQFVTDDSTVQALIREAKQRSATNLLLSHIYINAADSISATNKIKALAAALKKGESFEKLALAYSEDPAVQLNKGLIGWISAFTLPYELEQLAYTTPKNQVSPVYRSATAYHFFKVLDSRPATGKTTIAQLFLEVPENEEQRIQKKADSLYNVLKAGGDFAQLVYQFSNDNATYQKGGELLPFEAGTYDPDFEAVVASLNAPGDISKPFQSKQGYHIIKLMAREGIANTTAEEYEEEIRNRVLASDRYKLANEIAYQKAKKLTGLKWVPVTGSRNANTTIATIGRRQVTEGEFQLFKQDQAGLRPAGEKQPADATERERFIRQQVMQEYLRNLEIYRPDFAAQLKDFREGTLIFEAMQQQIWDKAASDEKGLSAFFTKNAGRYKWKESFRGVLFTCSDQATAITVFDQLKSQPQNWTAVTTRFSNTVLADTGRYEYDQLPFQLDPAKLAGGTLSIPQAIDNSEQYGFVYCIEKLPAKLPRDFENARGYVLNDYQLQLEEDWIKELKKTYPVKINRSVLNSLNR